MVAYRLHRILILAGIGFLFASSSAIAADTKVSGRVIVSGVPLDAGKVVLYLATGEFLGTKVAKDGTYAFQKLNVPTGTYSVTIEGQGIAAKYQDAKATPLRIEVREGENTFNFELQ